MISQLGKMSITSIFKGAKSKLLEIAALYGTITSRVNIEESPSPFQADESSKYLYLGGNSSQDICFLNSSETQNSGKNFNL